MTEYNPRCKIEDLKTVDIRVRRRSWLLVKGALLNVDKNLLSKMGQMLKDI